MSKRIRQLEDALQIEYGIRATGKHPLLDDHLLLVKKGLDNTVDPANPTNLATKSRVGEKREGETDNDEQDLVNAMGVLSVSEGGATRYIGASGSEVRLLAYGASSNDFSP